MLVDGPSLSQAGPYTVWNSTGRSPRPGAQQQQQRQITIEDGLLQLLLSEVEMLCMILCYINAQLLTDTLTVSFNF